MENKVKIWGTIYGRGVKIRGFVLKNNPILDQHSLETEWNAYDENGMSYYLKMNHADKYKYNFRPDKLIMNKITLKQIIDAPKGRVKIKIIHNRNFNQVLFPVGVLKGERIFKYEKVLSGFGGSTYVNITLSSGESYPLISLVHKRDQYCRALGIQTCLSKLRDEDVDTIIKHISSPVMES